MAEIVKFKTEYIENPIGIETQKPRFSWEYGLDKNLTQRNYRILVSSSIDLLKEDKGDKWDSGVINSSKNINIEYQGLPLASSELCYVKVVAETTCGLAESKINTFEMGLFQKDWEISWRTLPYTASGSALAFRRNFTAQNKEIERARAYVCGIGFHEFYINGKHKENGLLNPIVSDYSKVIYYNIYDITVDIKEHNGVGILCGNGWNGYPQVAMVVYLKYKDGTENYIKTKGLERTWKVKKSPIIENTIFDGETYDARLEEEIAGWSEYNPKFGLNTGWYYAVGKLHDPNIEIRSQLLHPIKSVEKIYPISTNFVNGKTILDFGKIITGWCAFTVRGNRDDEVSLRFSEVLFKDGRINPRSMRNAKNTDRYILKGNEKESYCPRFSYRGFRYVELTTSSRVEVVEIYAEKLRTASEKASTFTCSDELLNKLHNISVNTEECNHQSILTDCPQRDERMGWLNDLSCRLFQTVNNFNMELFFNKIEDDIFYSVNEEGAIKDVVPYFGLGNEIADPVSIAPLLIARFAFERYNDLRLVERHYENIKKWVNYLDSKTEDGVLFLGTYGDWVPAIELIHADNPRLNKAFPIPVISTTYLFWYFKELANLAKIVGNNVDCELYSIKAEKTRNLINEKFYNKETHRYCINVQAMNSIALSLGVCDEKEKENILNEIIKDLEGRNFHITCGNQAYRHLFEALSINGRSDVVLKVLKNREYPSWGYMVENGATTVWERWEKEISETEENMHSYCHPMFGGYDYWFFNFFAGIKFLFDESDVQVFSIKPQVILDIPSMQCEFNTLNGKLKVEYKIENKNIIYKLVVPSNTKANVELKNSQKTEIFELKSGEYEFKYEI